MSHSHNDLNYPCRSIQPVAWKAPLSPTRFKFHKRQLSWLLLMARGTGSQQEKIFCSSISQFNEIWWFYPHEDDGNECSRYYAFSISEGRWFSDDNAEEITHQHRGDGQLGVGAVPDDAGGFFCTHALLTRSYSADILTPAPPLQRP